MRKLRQMEMGHVSPCMFAPSTTCKGNVTCNGNGTTVGESMAKSGDKCKIWEQRENFYVFCCILSFLLRILRKLITNFNFDPKKVLQRINAMITNKVNNFQNEFILCIQNIFSKGCVAQSLCPIFMVDSSNDSCKTWEQGKNFYVL